MHCTNQMSLKRPTFIAITLEHEPGDKDSHGNQNRSDQQNQTSAYRMGKKREVTAGH
jgi:hypothetical protein